MGTLLDVQSWIIDFSIIASVPPVELALQSMVDPEIASRVPTDWLQSPIILLFSKQ
jgi:hypothetical protein